MPSGRRGEVVRAFGRFWQLRYVPALGWIEAASGPDMAGIFPGMIRNSDAEHMYRLWQTEPDVALRCQLVSRKALERAGSREWHWTFNMIKEIMGSWTYINGLLIRSGVRADTERLGDYLDAAYTLMLERLDKDGVKAFEARLRKIPGGLSVKPRMSSRDDLLAFAKD